MVKIKLKDPDGKERTTQHKKEKQLFSLMKRVKDKIFH